MSDSDTSPNSRKYTKIAVDTKSLIELIRDKPCLWDRTSDSYRDKLEKEKAWQEIYRVIDPTYEDLSPTKKIYIGNAITRKWYNVRDAYAKSRKPGVNRAYIYSRSLAFLDPIYVNTSTYIPEKRYKRETFDESNDDQEQPSDWVDEVFVDIDEHQDQTPSKIPKLEYSHKEEDESIVAVLANLIQKEEDVDRAFFKSITPAVKELSENSKFEFKIQVMKLIKKLKRDDRKKVKTGHTSETDTD